MSKRTVAVLTALGFLATGCLAASAQAPPAFKVGIIDLDAVGEGFAAKQLEEEKLLSWYRLQQQQLQQLSHVLFLTAASWGEAAEIIQTEKPTPAQDDRLQALTKESTDREREYLNLQSTDERTPEQDKRFEELLDMAQARQASLKALAEEIEGQLDHRKRTLGIELMKPVDEAIKAVAEERGLQIVVDSKLVYLGGEDITELVLQRVNASGGAPAAPATDTPPAGETPGEPPAEGGDGGQ